MIMTDKRFNKTESLPLPAYICNGEKCGKDYDCGECRHTTDIRFAKNFHYERQGSSFYYIENDDIQKGDK